jgi:hypothetical protein
MGFHHVKSGEKVKLHIHVAENMQIWSYSVL